MVTSSTVLHNDNYINGMSRITRKPDFCLGENKGADQPCSNCAVAAQLISTFVFATRKVQSLFLLNPKFEASSPLLLLHIPVCCRVGTKPQKPEFSRRGSYDFRTFDIHPHQLLSCVMRKPTKWFLNKSNTNQAVLAQEDGLRLEILDLESRGTVLAM